MATAIPDGLEELPVRERAQRGTAAAPITTGEDAACGRVAGHRPAAATAEPRDRAAEPSANQLDLELVQRVQRGQTAAFDLLVSRYQHRVANLLARYIADPVECEDVAQETFLRAYRGLRRFRGESAFYTWLYRIAVNTALNHRSWASRRPASFGADSIDGEDFHDSPSPQDADTPEGNAAMGEVQQTIEHALASMPESLRRALVLREMDGLTYEEIATAMDCPIGTVRSRIARARSAIDEFLRPVLERPESGATR